MLEEITKNVCLDSFCDYMSTACLCDCSNTNYFLMRSHTHDSRWLSYGGENEIVAPHTASAYAFNWNSMLHQNHTLKHTYWGSKAQKTDCVQWTPCCVRWCNSAGANWIMVLCKFRESWICVGYKIGKSYLCCFLKGATQGLMRNNICSHLRARYFFFTYA